MCRVTRSCLECCFFFSFQVLGFHLHPLALGHCVRKVEREWADGNTKLTWKCADTFTYTHTHTTIPLAFSSLRLGKRPKRWVVFQFWIPLETPYALIVRRTSCCFICLFSWINNPKLTIKIIFVLDNPFYLPHENIVEISEPSFSWARQLSQSTPISCAELMAIERLVKTVWIMNVFSF